LDRCEKLKEHVNKKKKPVKAAPTGGSGKDNADEEGSNAKDKKN